MIKDTAYNLESRLQRIDKEIASVAADRETLLEDSSIDLQDEKAMTVECLRICECLSSYIKSLPDGHLALQREAPQQSAAYVLNKFEAQLLTQKSLNENRDNLLETISRLRERLVSITANGGPDGENETLRLQEKINCSKLCLEVCKEASNQKVHIGEVIANEDCDQVVVTTLADLFNVGKMKAMSRSVRLSGSIPADLLRDISKDRYGSRFGALEWSGNMDSNFPEFPKVLSRDTDVNTLFSKDSGYSSMVSKKTHQPNPDDGQDIHDSAKWESESVASVKSLATMNTVSSVNPTAAGGVAEELAEMLVRDESICGLIKDGYKNFKSDRFERNLRRILKKFALSLRREARNDLEKSAVRLVHNYRAFVIIHIKKYLELPDDRHATSLYELQKQKQSQLALERFLELLPGAEEINAEDQLEQNESGSDIDSDLSNDEQPYLPTLEKVKLYLVSSTAYSEFKQQLAEFVRPPCTTYHLPSDKSALAGMELRSNKVVDMGEGDLATEESEVLGPISDAKSDVSFSQFGSSSIDDVEVVCNTVLDAPQQNEKERLRNFYVEELSLKGLKPKHGRLEEVLLPSKLWVTISLKHLSFTLQNRWAKWRRRPVAKGRSRIEWTCVSTYSTLFVSN
jgi:anion-transporting  ArsA/GET3 family ATPase